MMSPLEIDIVLWYHTRAVDYRDGDFSAPAVRQTIDAFKGALGLLELFPDGERPTGDCRTYRLTERGRAYVTALTALPLPTCQWVICSPAGVVMPALAENSSAALL